MRLRNKALLVAAVAIAGCGALVLILRGPEPRSPSAPSPNTVQKTAVAPVASPATTPSTSQPSQAGSVQDVVGLIKQAAADGTSAADLYRKLAALGLKDRSWWRNAEEVSALLDLAADRSLADEYRTVAVGLYLAAAPQDQIVQNSNAIQQLASGGSDTMASAVLQGMADRAVAPVALTKEILSTATRGTGAKCHAWYAARLTQKNDPVLAGIALAATDTGMTEASKVAFDYLASGAYAPQYEADPGFRQKTDAMLGEVQALPAESDPIGLANGDAFIRAIPSITPLDTAVDSLFALVQEAQNPEMRLSAIEQLVSIHLAGSENLSQELHEVRNNIATLFPDPVKQNRAKKRLNRATAPQSQ